MTLEETKRAINTHVDLIKLLVRGSSLGELHKSDIRDHLDYITELLKKVCV